MIKIVKKKGGDITKVDILNFLEKIIRSLASFKLSLRILNNWALFWNYTKRSSLNSLIMCFIQFFMQTKTDSEN